MAALRGFCSGLSPRHQSIGDGSGLGPAGTGLLRREAIADLLGAAAHFSPTPWEPAEAGFAGAKHRGIELRLVCGCRSAGKYPVELRAIECDQQQIHARVDRLDHGSADIVLI